MNPEALSLKEKYRSFLIPSIRRVYIPIDIDDDDEDTPDRVAREAEAEVRRSLRPDRSVRSLAIAAASFQLEICLSNSPC